MEAGDEFEIEQVQQLVDEVGESQVRHEGVGTVDGRQQVLPLSLETFLQILQERPLPQYVAQLDIDLGHHPEIEHRFLQRFGLDPSEVRVGSARPDLLEVISMEGDEPDLLRIWDVKASQSARHEHFIQVAYYSFLLEAVLEEMKLTDSIAVDTEFAVILSREGQEEFELAPYRLAVEDFLRNRAPTLLATLAADAHYHVREKCALCEYMDTCQAEADAHFDLSRVPYISSESKRKLQSNGIRSHRELAQVQPDTHEELIETLQASSHDLSMHLSHYIASAQALEDGQIRLLDNSTLRMPQWENIRVVLSAEHDPVTNTCFAIGFKTYEGWDQTNNRPIGTEEVFISEGSEHEADLLLNFLRTLNQLLVRVDRDNSVIAEQPIDADPRVVVAQQRLDQAQDSLAQFKSQHPRLYRRNPDYEQLNQQREGLKEQVKQAERDLRRAERDANWERYIEQDTLHFYVYDGLDLLVLKSLVERHLFDPDPDLLGEIRTLVRLFPPESVLPDAETFRTIPGTIVTQVLRNLTALPIPYLYELRAVSEAYQPIKQSGEESGYQFRPRYGFGWRHSNQVAFERIHGVWREEEFVPDSRNPSRVYSAADVRNMLERTVRDKLRATDSIVRRLKQDFGDRLLLRKEPFRLYADFDPLDFQMLEALRVFTILEASLNEMAVKHLHTLSVEDRTAKFECVRGLHYLVGEDESDGSLWFTFDPTSRDAKFDEGDFNLVLTPEDAPECLLGDVDGRLFDTSRWRHEPYRVTLMEYDLDAEPPRLRLLPRNTNRLLERVDLSQACVLDRLYVDYNSPKVLETLQHLQAAPEQARHIHELVAGATVEGWQPFIQDTDRLEQLLRQQVAQSDSASTSFLNTQQWRAFHGVSQEPLTLIWGPPGTGKTYTLGHILLGYVLAAHEEQQPLRILVTAFTHHAISNVLRKVSELVHRYGITTDQLVIAKAHGGYSHSADALLPDSVERIRYADLDTQVQRDDLRCLVVGSTVWGIYNATNRAGGIVQPWFDVILVDEASQLKLPDALVALTSSKPGANIILAGDDRQLPPIIHGTYPEEHEYMLTSVFAFMRHRMEERQAVEPDFEQRVLFQLEQNFRMNEPLTAYPRQVIYQGRFFSEQPSIRIVTDPRLEAEADDVIDFMLHPARPVVLCWYSSPVSFTARNPIEAELVAQLTERLSAILIDGSTGQVYESPQFASQGVAVLSPHRAQNSTIRQVLSQYGFGEDEQPLPLVDTVDKLQGQERDVVLVSYGVADEEYAEAEADFLLSSNRFNVATTRPRQKLVLFCSQSVLNVVPDDRRILLDSMMLKEFRRYCDDGLVQFTWQSPDHGELTLNVQWKGFDE
jgi:hypothetical protein